MSLETMKRYAFRFSRTACFEAEVYAASAEEAFAAVKVGDWKHERMVRKPRMKDLPKQASQLEEHELNKVEYVVKAIDAEIASRLVGWSPEHLSRKEAKLEVEKIEKISDDILDDEEEDLDLFRVSFFG